MAEAIRGMTAELYQAIVALIDERVREIRVTREDFHELREDFHELKEVVHELAEAQVRTEQRLNRLEAVVEELAQAQINFTRTFDSKMGALGARWGLDTEESFRQGMRAILEDVGFKVEHYLVYDGEGKVFDRPDQVELDVIVRDGKLMLIEIKSSTGRADVAAFHRKVRFYEEREGRKADRRIMVSPFVEEGARKLALALDTEIYTRAENLANS